jgi:hypothetical protein
VYEVEVGYPVVGYQQAKGHVEQGRVHQVHLPHTESTKHWNVHILPLSDWIKILLSHFRTSCVYVFVVKSYLFV